MKCDFPGCKVKKEHNYYFHSEQGSLWKDDKITRLQINEDITDPKWIHLENKVIYCDSCEDCK